MDKPTRIQRRRVKGWKMPAGAVYVGRGSRYGNPYKLGETQVRTPAIDGTDFEREGRSGKPSGSLAAFHHQDRSITWHQVEDATAAQVVELFRRELLRSGKIPGYPGSPTIAEVRRDLAGKTLACWCSESEPCHADVLLEVCSDA
ncbi:DUF4326 domain-containing protein [Rhodococcus erythropolis]|uniref:DUF4326 domain-containing protein n=1 Tax=Rhodococcus erythropolis TaxID=1833 RepID=UPI0024BBBDFB|nr:DUF4326 domain-containing protein [Rhodococcus erythropolis]MDJ0403933.1 DUF4326 domain-containing protein [Rhodococcus erythropolis]